MEGRPSPSSLPAVVVLSLLTVFVSKKKKSLDSRKEGRGSGEATGKERLLFLVRQRMACWEISCHTTQ
jgi:hypothetical protein